MNEFDLKDYLKDNKLLQEENKPLVNEGPVTLSLAAIKAALIGGGITLGGIASLYFMRITVLRQVNKFLRDKFQMDIGEVAPMVMKYLKSRLLPTSQEYKDRSDQKHSLYLEIQKIYVELDKNHYTRNEGENLIQLSKNLNTRFYKLGTKDFKKMIKLLEEALILTEKALAKAGDISAKKIDLSLGPDNKPEDFPTAAALMLLQSQLKFDDLRKNIESTLAEVHNKFKAYKSMVATKSPNIKK